MAVPVGETTANRLISTLAPRIRSLKIGPGTDHEPLANRHSSWCRIRNGYHVLIAMTGPLRTQAAGAVHRRQR